MLISVGMQEREQVELDGVESKLGVAPRAELAAGRSTWCISLCVAL